MILCSFSDFFLQHFFFTIFFLSLLIKTHSHRNAFWMHCMMHHLVAVLFVVASQLPIGKWTLTLNWRLLNATIRLRLSRAVYGGHVLCFRNLKNILKPNIYIFGITPFFCISKFWFHKILFFLIPEKNNSRKKFWKKIIPEKILEKFRKIGWV